MGTISQEGEDFGHRRQSAHVAASARALMASDARSAAQAAVDSAEINLKGPRFRTASNSTTGTRRRAEEYLAAPPVSGVRDDVRRKAPVTSQAAGGSAQGARAWYQGLARQKAEVEASVRVLNATVLSGNDCLQWQADSIALVSAPNGGEHQDVDGSKPMVIRDLFSTILQHLDSGNCESVRALILDLSEKLKVSQGHVSRRCGGIQYRPEYMLDCIHFVDNLRPLNNEIDVVRQALETLLELLFSTCTFDRLYLLINHR
eukprot:Skav228584  [mRNA]  locus=scaffold1470:140077:144906:+ [translate_table: standard]